MFKITELVSATFSQASSVVSQHFIPTPTTTTASAGGSGSASVIINSTLNSSSNILSSALASAAPHSNFDAISEQFAQFIERIGKVQSRELEYEEIQKMKKELRTKLSQNPNLINDRYEMKEVILRLLYCEMMGHSTEHFAAIHVVNFCALSDLSVYEKRLAYLALTLLLHRNHELMLLMINVIQKDLKSPRYLNVVSALIASAKLINLETIPAILPFVVPLLKHQRSEVRKRAISTLHSFYLMERERKCFNVGASNDDSFSGNYLQYIDLSLNDFDTSVLHAAMCFLCDYAADCHIQLISKQKEYLSQKLIEIIPYELKHIDKRVLKLSQVVVSILNQIIECNIFTDYIYGKLPAPWFQIKALQCLSLLGRYNKQVSQEMYEIIKSTYKRAEKAKNDIGTAVMFQCIKTATNIYPSPQLLNFIFDAVTRYIWNQDFKNVNSRYVSLEMLRMVLKSNPGLVLKHQDMVIDSLDSHDETIQKLTTRLLVKMVNKKNVKLIVERLTKCLKHVISVNDLYMAEEIIGYVSIILEKYGSIDLKWYSTALIKFLQVVGNERNMEGKPLISENATNKFTQTILNLQTGEEENTIQFVSTFLFRILEDAVHGSKNDFSNSIFTIAICVLKGMNNTTEDKSSRLPAGEHLVDLFVDMLNSPLDVDSSVKCCILSSLLDIYVQASWKDKLFERIENSLNVLKSSRNEEIVERTYQLFSIHSNARNCDSFSSIFSREKVATDSDLPFVRSFVIEQIKKGASLYSNQKKKEVFEALLSPASSKANKPLIIKVDNINQTELKLKSDQVQSATNDAHPEKKNKIIWGPEDSITVEEEKLINDKPEVVKMCNVKLKERQSFHHDSKQQTTNDFAKAESNNVSMNSADITSNAEALQETEESEMIITITC
ncbi:hypothetical protein FDP41_004406 [Naegleria fowleri]|uniref:Clathrin/coatomer adaptor adaptin-like N-terminal domain-containing protein n=1 Tax=Naegleria fowleri TaxID=5763 RepID=A0A6A5BHV6_NAEFO|nr:uncharacterized protein FDP41_004406 [Naegleria fowleri]KAF0976507.1 hypothetical protein FDP41_004406 [Naegleria fowleri]